MAPGQQLTATLCSWPLQEYGVTYAASHQLDHGLLPPSPPELEHELARGSPPELRYSGAEEVAAAAEPALEDRAESFSTTRAPDLVVLLVKRLGYDCAPADGTSPPPSNGTSTPSYGTPIRDGAKTESDHSDGSAASVANEIDTTPPFPGPVLAAWDARKTSARDAAQDAQGVEQDVEQDAVVERRLQMRSRSRSPTRSSQQPLPQMPHQLLRSCRLAVDGSGPHPHPSVWCSIAATELQHRPQRS
jgi:hypothetical protein